MTDTHLQITPPGLVIHPPLKTELALVREQFSSPESELVLGLLLGLVLLFSGMCLLTRESYDMAKGYNGKKMSHKGKGSQPTKLVRAAKTAQKKAVKKKAKKK